MGEIVLLNWSRWLGLIKFPPRVAFTQPRISFLYLPTTTIIMKSHSIHPKLKFMTDSKIFLNGLFPASLPGPEYSRYNFIASELFVTAF